MSKSRWLSLIIAVFYMVCLTIFYLQGRLQDVGAARSFLVFVAWLILSLACIWFAEQIAPIFGPGRLRDYLPSNWTIVVGFFGWLMLFAPLIIFVFQKIK